MRRIFADGLGANGEFAAFHPLVTLLYFGCVIGVSMFFMHPLFLAETLLAAVFYSMLRGDVKQFRFILLVCLPILFVTAVVSPLFNHRGVTVLFYLNGNQMTLEAILYGLAAAAMLVSVVVWFSCFSRVVTSDKFIYLFGRILPVLSLNKGIFPALRVNKLRKQEIFTKRKTLPIKSARFFW